jgi:hypothetical protein
MRYGAHDSDVAAEITGNLATNDTKFVRGSQAGGGGVVDDTPGRARARRLLGPCALQALFSLQDNILFSHVDAQNDRFTAGSTVEDQ